MEPKPTDGNIDRPNRAVTLMILAVLAVSMVICCGIGTALLLPAIQEAIEAREARRRQQTAENLRQIGLALRSYRDTHNVYLDGKGELIEVVPGPHESTEEK